jgi:hypothetical protein
MSALKGRRTVLTTLIITAALLSACAAPQPPTVSHAAPQMTPVPVATAVHVPGLKELTGLRPTDIVAILGQPDLRRDEPPAQLWQYRATDCILNLFFYREKDGYRLAHAETWQRNLAGGTVPARCHDENAPVRAHLVSTQSSL